MKLGLMLGYSGPKLEIPLERVQLAERLGFDSVWTAEAYGSDAITPLAWLAAQTQRIRLGTAVMQLAGRTPAMAAMQIGTLDALAPGRAICGIGVSGPQIVEGWYGQPWGKPYWRIRDYVQIMKKVFKPGRSRWLARWSRDLPALFKGEAFDGHRQAAALDPAHEPRHPDLARHRYRHQCASDRGDRRRLVAAELRAGLARRVPSPRSRRASNARAGARAWKDFEIQAADQRVSVTDDIRAALQRPQARSWRCTWAAWGTSNKNFHNDMMVRRGYGDAARAHPGTVPRRPQDRWPPTAAVPDEYIDEGALLGPPQRIRERYRAWEDAGVTGLTLNGGRAQELELMAELAGTRPS